jgi:polysaccharide export outer membrane protein
VIEKLLERTALGVLLACACVTQAIAGQEQSSKPAAKSPPLAAATGGAAAGAGAGAAAPVATNDPRVGGAAPFQIGPEDILDISVWKNPELSRTVPVRPDGKVSLPLVNDIQAAGLTPATLREQVTERLAEFIPAPEVSVMVREVHSRKVAVVGAVKTPGRFELKSPMTVLEVIALAQGFTDFASRDRIVVLRQTGTTTTRVPFNYRKIAEGVDQENFFVKPGDVVVVP